MAAADSRLPRQVVDGVLLLDKPAGLTSNQALQKVKRLLNAKKAGHTGSLDPAATGMLPLCFGEATKVCAYILDADKSYRVSARLGESTDTGDSDGKVTATAPVPGLGAADWQAVFERFIGEIEQVPPMYSALKVGGRRLYELARKGESVERQPRAVRIYELCLLEARGPRLVFRTRCSKGTYVRTLVEDLAAAAGTIAYTASLHRERVGEFLPEEMLDMARIEQLAEDDPGALRSRLLGADRALMRWPQCRLSADVARGFVAGKVVTLQSEEIPGQACVRVYTEDGAFLGVGECTGPGKLAPRRVFRS